MTAAMIIASGKTKNKTNFEPAKVIGSITAVERVTILLQQAGVQRIVVVCDEDDKIRKIRSVSNLTFLAGPKDGEMLDSIKTGLSYLHDKCSKALIVYVDVPMFSIATLRALMDADGDVCIPSYHGRWGHPILLRTDRFCKVMSYHGDRGLRGAIDASGIKKQIVEVDDAGIRADIQRDQFYKELLPDHDASRMRLSYQLGIGKERVFYDDNVHQLLSLTEELGSLSRACVYMGISLNKGRTVISTIEQQLGQPVLVTQQGGKNGGYSHLTPEIKTLSLEYNAFCSEAEDILQELFRKHFVSNSKIADNSERNDSEGTLYEHNIH